MQGLEVNLFDSVPSSCFSDLQQNIKHIYIYHRIKAVGFRLATWSVSFNRTLFQTVAARCALTKSKNRFFSNLSARTYTVYIYIYYRIKAVGLRSATWIVTFRRTWFQTVAARCALTQSLLFQINYTNYSLWFFTKDRNPFSWRPFLSVWVAVDVQWRWIDRFQISK